GGMAKAIEAGIPKMRIEEAAAKKQARIDSGKDTIVGVNLYQVMEESHDFEIREVDNDAVKKAQIKRLKELKAERNPQEVEQALAKITASAKSGNGNLLDLAIDAARKRAT